MLTHNYILFLAHWTVLFDYAEASKEAKPNPEISTCSKNQMELRCLVAIVPSVKPMKKINLSDRESAIKVWIKILQIYPSETELIRQMNFKTMHEASKRMKSL